MKTLELKEATASLADYVPGIGLEPLVLLANGKPVAALLAVEDEDLETLSLSTNPRFLDLIERSRRRHEAEGGISSDEMRRRLGLVQ
ncbi:MAG: hypothetical protein ACREXT_02440 [Gammaproteobacteria bacterium]